MPTDEAQSPPFDEQAALEELERLRAAIEESRRQRSQRSDEFEAFVRSFRTPPAPAPSPAAAVERQQTADRPPAVPDPIDQPAAVAPPPVEHPPANEPPASAPVVQTAPPPKRRTGAFVPRALGGTAILIASVVLLMRPWKAVRSETTSSPQTSAAPASEPAPSASTPAPTEAPAPAPPPAPATENAHALNAELNVQRRVWVRVLLDGQRAIERELPPGTRIPLQADRAIVIRAGDAGALRLTINGVDRGPLGRDAEIVTRTFTAQR